MPEALRGDLAWVSLGGLLQLLESERTSGAVELPGAGRITLAHGRPVAATSGDLTGLTALLQALVLRAGVFRIMTGDPPAEPGAPLADVSMAVLEGCRLLDELDRLGPLRLRSAGPPPEDEVARRLVDAMDGDRTVAEVIAGAGVPEVLAVDRLVPLLEAGRVVEAAPPDRARARAASTAGAPAAAPSPDDPAELVDRAREAVRARDLATAAALFRRAAELAPNDRLIAQNLHRVDALLRQSS